MEVTMDESQAKQEAAKWSQLLLKKGIPHVVIGSVAMLLHECKPYRAEFKDIDILILEDKEQKMRGILEEDGFTNGKNGNYEKDGVTIGIATPGTHRGLPDPSDNSVRTKIGDVCVLTLEGLIDAKRLAVESNMNRIVSGGYRRNREKSVFKHLKDFCVLCRHLANLKANSTPH
jgi:hypothetical protein